MTLVIKRIHNLPPHLRYVSIHYWHYTKTEKLCCLPISNESGSEKSRFWCIWNDSEPVVWL